MRQDCQIVFHPMNRVISVQPGTNLLAALRSANVQIESICGGKGECGKCRVIIDSGDYHEKRRTQKSHLSSEERGRGYRLACEIVVSGNMEVTVPVESRIERPQILCGLLGECDCGGMAPSVRTYPLEIRSDPVFPLSVRSIRLLNYSGPRPTISEAMYQKITGSDTRLKALLTETDGYPELIDLISEEEMKTPLGIALDLGTTTIACAIVDLESGIVLAEEATLNRQITYGEEVITRISFARNAEGLRLLQQAAAESINYVITRVTESAGVQPDDLMEICIGGNTVMTHLINAIDPGYLELADADVQRKPFIRKAQALGINLHSGAYCYCLPNVSRFVGGDAVAGVLSSGLHCGSELSLFIDLGTNGEIVLGNKDWIASISCASGPAFEGAGISSGMRAMHGAIERVAIEPDSGEAHVMVIGGARPRGICGSGLIDAVTGMFKAGILDFKGILKSHPLVRTGHAGPEYVLVPAAESATGQDIVITQPDMDYFMDSKAALCGGIGVLMKKYRLKVTDIRHIYLAGAFGAFVNLQNTVAFGIIPSFPFAEVHPVGNTSLKGAYAALVSLEKRREAQKIASMMVYIDLLVDSDFIEEYTAALSIPGKEEYFRDSSGEGDAL
ncbi:MAG: ASKHA domain-containing protein [Methanocalculus sp.]|uniref:ASKHA domain-containing protein n=1 Tax=Methanocalculus sp. TaxID=2004547 RepID=UPI00271A10D2|nr:ASKHA domain-containing protein [Methanocalculus sp.]MDO9538991.1 ASKHA domain-containing protein [Methanocalculus sp.]